VRPVASSKQWLDHEVASSFFICANSTVYYVSAGFIPMDLLIPRWWREFPHDLVDGNSDVICVLTLIWDQTEASYINADAACSVWTVEILVVNEIRRTMLCVGVRGGGGSVSQEGMMM
jgi:hypothetical protein